MNWFKEWFKKSARIGKYTSICRAIIYYHIQFLFFLVMNTSKSQGMYPTIKYKSKTLPISALSFKTGRPHRKSCFPVMATSVLEKTCQIRFIKISFASMVLNSWKLKCMMKSKVGSTIYLTYFFTFTPHNWQSTEQLCILVLHDIWQLNFQWQTSFINSTIK